MDTHKASDNFPELSQPGSFYWPLLRKSFVLKKTVGGHLELEIAFSVKTPLDHSHLVIRDVQEIGKIKSLTVLRRASIRQPFQNLKRIMDLGGSSSSCINSGGARYFSSRDHWYSGSVCWSYEKNWKRYRALDEVSMYVSESQMSEISQLLAGLRDVLA